MTVFIVTNKEEECCEEHYRVEVYAKREDALAAKDREIKELFDRWELIDEDGKMEEGWIENTYGDEWWQLYYKPNFGPIVTITIDEMEVL